MKKWLGRSLKHKLSLLIIVVALVPLLFHGIFSYNIAAGLTEEKAKISYPNTLRQLEAYLDTMVKDVENMSLFLIGHNGVQESPCLHDAANNDGTHGGQEAGLCNTTHDLEYGDCNHGALYLGEFEGVRSCYGDDARRTGAIN